MFPLGPLPPEAPFEGRLHVQVVSEDPSEGGGDTISYYFTVKGKKARWDLFSKRGMGAPSGYRIFDGEQHKFFTVMRQPVLYTTTEAALTPDAGAPRPLRFTPFKLEPKGRVQDLPCDHVEAEEGDLEYNTCLSSDVPPIPLHLLGGAIASAVPFGAQLMKKGVFPLTVVIRPRTTPDAGGAARPIVARLTTIKVERGRVPDEAFTLPSFPETETPGLIAPGLVR